MVQHSDRIAYREQEGTGIGLALTKELVELHGGSIHMSSRSGIGTIVTIRLPIQHEYSVKPVPEANPHLVASPVIVPIQAEKFSETDGCHSADASLVLLIEDNDDVRTFIRSSLDDQYQIVEAANGEEGVRLAQQQVPDLVITDLMMPNMNGYQVCAQSAHQPDPRRFLTADSASACSGTAHKKRGQCRGRGLYGRFRQSGQFLNQFFPSLRLPTQRSQKKSQFLALGGLF